MSDSDLYLHHRRQADEAFARDDGGAYTGHAAAAHAALQRYATTHGLTTDEAAARIRRLPTTPRKNA